MSHNLLEFITNGIFNIFHLFKIVLYISNFIQHNIDSSGVLFLSLEFILQFNL